MLALCASVSCSTTHSPPKQKGGQEILARVTSYDGDDHWSRKRQTSTGVRMKEATPKSIGIAAIDPNIIPYGSLLKLEDRSGNMLCYLAADCGSAVISKKAVFGTISAEIRNRKYEPGSKEHEERKKALVVDVHSVGEKQVGDIWQQIQVVKYQGTVPFKKLPLEEKLRFLDRKTWKL